MTKVHFRYNYERTPLELDRDETGAVTLNYTDPETNKELNLKYGSMKEFAEFYATSCGVKTENLKNWVLLEDGLEYTYQLKSGTAGLDLDESELDTLIESFQNQGMTPKEIGQALAGLLAKEKTATDSSQPSEQLEEVEEPLEEQVEKVEQWIRQNLDNDDELLSLLRENRCLPEKDDTELMLEFKKANLDADNINRTMQAYNYFLAYTSGCGWIEDESKLEQFIENYKDDHSDLDYVTDEDEDVYIPIDNDNCYFHKTTSKYEIYDKDAVDFYLTLLKTSYKQSLVVQFADKALDKQALLQKLSLKTLLKIERLRDSCFDTTTLKREFAKESMAQLEVKNHLIGRQLLNNILNTGNPQVLMIELKPVYDNDKTQDLKCDIDVKGYQFYTTEMDKQFAKTSSCVVYSQDGTDNPNDTNHVVVYYDVNNLK